MLPVTSPSPSLATAEEMGNRLCSAAVSDPMGMGSEPAYPLSYPSLELGPISVAQREDFRSCTARAEYGCAAGSSGEL
jgi:hypothetical protein